MNGKLFRFIIKTIFIFGSLWYFISGMYGQDLSLSLFEHCFRFLIILCFVAKLSVFAVSRTTEMSSRIKRLIIVIAVCILGWIAAELFYTYVVRKILVIVGYYIGAILLLGFVLIMTIPSVYAASAAAASVAGFSKLELIDQIHNGVLNADGYNGSYIKDELRSRGIDYDEERKNR